MVQARSRLLCDMARPQYGIVTNVGVSHLERMKTRDVVARAKAELVEALPADGLAILNGDDSRVRAMRERTAARVLCYGLDASNDRMGKRYRRRRATWYGIYSPFWHGERRIQTALLGEHNVYTAMTAIIIARELGVPWAAIDIGLNAPDAQARLQIVPGLNGATLLDDSYNASPTSCAAALDVLARTPGRHIAVFGDMAELGPEEEEGHREVGRSAQNVDLLVVVGAKARWIGLAAAECNPSLPILYAATNAEASAALREHIGVDDYILVKGARVAATEQIVVALRREGMS